MEKAEEAALAIHESFHIFDKRFKEISRRAKSRFESRDWPGMQKDALERLELYKVVVDRTVANLKEILAGRAEDKNIWAAMKARYSGLIAYRKDVEVAQTFFNSITRRILITVGVDKTVEFTDSDFDRASGDVLDRGAADKTPSLDETPVFKKYPPQKDTRDLVRMILSDYSFEAGYENLEADSRLAAERIDLELEKSWGGRAPDKVEIIRPIFYRNNNGYVVGRVSSGQESLPLVLALANREGGVAVDAALLSHDEASIVFSFTRSYFHIETDDPSGLIRYLKILLPMKPVSELYISIGYNKHGKTELYRDLMRHMENSSDKFEIARGEKGMVMMVFTLPSYDVVFKIIKDRFSYTKKATRQTVMEKYHLVFKHDRAGRLVDAQEFEHMEFRKSRFSEELLKELLDAAPGSVKADGDRVVISHLYTERRLIPLNLYIKEARPDQAREAVVDYGNVIKDLAAANIFPGDILLKNFGVTRHERVVFYDYDELCLLTECNIREFPVARDPDEELEAEPWYYVGDYDIFPEEFRTFLGFEGELKDVFVEAHADLFTVRYWREIQERMKRGEVADIFPYKQSRRLRRT